MNYKQKIGEFGEDLACDYLKRKGYDIVDRNVKNSYQEIDIVAKKDDIFVFVEVKTRTSDTMGEADEQINNKKLENLNNAIINYLDIHSLDEIEPRLDLIAIDIKRKFRRDSFVLPNGVEIPQLADTDNILKKNDLQKKKYILSLKLF